jgi:hypothetical protein
MPALNILKKYKRTVPKGEAYENNRHLDRPWVQN